MTEPKKANRNNQESASLAALRKAKEQNVTEVTQVTVASPVPPVTRIHKPKKERSNVTIPADTMEYLKVMAWIKRTDVTKYINMILKEHMKNNEEGYKNAKAVFKNFNDNA